MPTALFPKLLPTTDRPRSLILDDPVLTVAVGLWTRLSLLLDPESSARMAEIIRETPRLSGFGTRRRGGAYGRATGTGQKGSDVRRIAVAVVGAAVLTLSACGSTQAATEPTTTTVTTQPAGHSTARTMTDSDAGALACQTYAATENRITATWDAFGSAQKSGAPDALTRLDEYQDARADWMAQVGAALAVAPGYIYTEMMQAPAFFGYWAGTGTRSDGANAYAYSLVLADVDKACTDADHPMHLAASTQGRVGLPPSLQVESG